MKLFPDTFPLNIPYVLAGFIGGCGAVFGFTALIAEMYLGRPNSTHALGFIFIPVYASMLFLACFAAGLVARFITGIFVAPRPVSSRGNKITTILFACSLALAFVSGVALIEVREIQQRPHVVFDAGRITKISPAAIKEKKRIQARFVFSFYSDEKKNESFLWNNREVYFKKNDNYMFSILDRKGNDLAAADLHAYDYIGQIHALQLVVDDSGKKGLAVLVTLRASSRRLMLLVYDPAAKLIYQELLLRCDDNGISLLVDDAGREYLYSDVDSPAVYCKKGVTPVT